MTGCLKFTSGKTGAGAGPTVVSHDQNWAQHLMGHYGENRKGKCLLCDSAAAQATPSMMDDSGRRNSGKVYAGSGKLT
jgi:hypothetical protein